MEQNSPTKNLELSGCYLEITSECNLRCKHCYNDSGVPDSKISIKTFEKIIESFVEPERTSISISGGEPLLHPDIKIFLEMVREKHFAKSLMITNATLIDKAVASMLLNSGIGIQVSINGSCSETHDKLCGKGTFERTIRGLDILLESGIDKNNMVVRVMLSNYNQNDLLQTVKYITNKGIKKIIVAAVTPFGRAKSNLDEMYIDKIEQFAFLNQFKQEPDIIELEKQGYTVDLPSEFSGGCPAILNQEAEGEKKPVNPRIDPNGDVFLCQLFMDNKYSLGNVNQENLRDIIKSKKTESLIMFARYGIMYIHDCKKCVWSPVCGRGCVAMSINNGSIQETDGDCYFRKKHHKKNFKEQILLQNQ